MLSAPYIDRGKPVKIDFFSALSTASKPCLATQYAWLKLPIL